MISIEVGKRWKNSFAPNQKHTRKKAENVVAAAKTIARKVERMNECSKKTIPIAKAKLSSWFLESVVRTFMFIIPFL